MIEVPYTVRPIEVWPGPQTTDRGFSPFRADLSSTLGLLESELRAVGATHAFLQVACRPGDIRVDGRLRRNASRPDHPGIILTFEDLKGNVVNLPCDTYRDWRDNLRGIALSLKALRAVDRYGVTKSGEQYRGFTALPAEGGSSGRMNVQQALEVLIDVAEDPVHTPDDLRVDPVLARGVYVAAAKKAHPDQHGGDGRRMTVLTEAKSVVDEYHKIR